MMNIIVNYHREMVFIQISEIVSHLIVFIYGTSSPVMCMVSKEYFSTNFVRIPFQVVKGKYEVHIKWNNEEVIKTLIVT